MSVAFQGCSGTKFVPKTIRPSGQREAWLKEKRFESAYSTKDSECPKWHAV